ncbi:uncharacterized protein LOC119282503 [Triticum dicoccoides]|uniref:uncharacterized protein LOC119282503 n=1 Tax=Triticum dicoccoides TaxID=85692 RepID=UPI00188DFCD3|nr:uncharacterized protein LOC119282503 [Triticum dicoccoides]
MYNVLPSLFHQIGLSIALARACTSTLINQKEAPCYCSNEIKGEAAAWKLFCRGEGRCLPRPGASPLQPPSRSWSARAGRLDGLVLGRCIELLGSHGLDVYTGAATPESVVVVDGRADKTAHMGATVGGGSRCRGSDESRGLGCRPRGRALHAGIAQSGACDNV